MEERFGRDFSHVRLHHGASSAAAASLLDAAAFTVGRDIVFGAGHWRPNTPTGRRLLAHELAHVVQQERTGTTMVQRQVVPAPTTAAPTFSVDRNAYERRLRRALASMSSQLVSGTTFAPAIVPILRRMLASAIWRDASGVAHGGHAIQFTVPGTSGTTLTLSLVLDDMVDPPVVGQFAASGTTGTVAIRVRQAASTDELAEVLYHESLHMMTWIMGTHGGTRVAAGVSREAVEGLQLSRFTRQIANIRRILEPLRLSVNSRRSAGQQISGARVDRMARWLMEEVLVRAETEVFALARQVDMQRGAPAQLYTPTRPYGAISRRMVDEYVFGLSTVFVPADRAGLTGSDHADLRDLRERLVEDFRHQVRRRFSLIGHTLGSPRPRPNLLSPPPHRSFIPRIEDPIREGLL